MSENITESNLPSEQESLQELLSKLLIRWNQQFADQNGSAISFVEESEQRAEIVPEELRQEYWGEITEKELLEMLILEKDSDWLFNNLLTTEEKILMESLKKQKMIDLNNDESFLEEVSGDVQARVEARIATNAGSLIGLEEQMKEINKTHEQEMELFEKAENYMEGDMLDTWEELEDEVNEIFNNFKEDITLYRQGAWGVWNWRAKKLKKVIAPYRQKWESQKTKNENIIKVVKRFLTDMRLQDLSTKKNEPKVLQSLGNVIPEELQNIWIALNKKTSQEEALQLERIGQALFVDMDIMENEGSVAKEFRIAEEFSTTGKKEMLEDLEKSLDRIELNNSIDQQQVACVLVKFPSAKES